MGRVGGSPDAFVSTSHSPNSVSDYSLPKGLTNPLLYRYANRNPQQVSPKEKVPGCRTEHTYPLITQQTTLCMASK